MSTVPADRVPEPPAMRHERRPREIARVLRRKRQLRAGTVQLVAIAVAIGLAFLMPQVHIGVEIPTSRAIEMLVAAGAGTVAFIGIVFSLLFLVVQFGSTAFSPRLNLFRDAPIVWRTFSFYTGVVVYSLTAALVIGREEKTSAAVPIVAFVAVLASIILYRQLQIGAFKSIQLSSTLAQVAHRGRVVIDGLYVLKAPVADPINQPGSAGAPSPSEHALHEVRWPRRDAIVQVIDVPRVVRAAQRADVVLQFKVGSGEMISEGATVAVVRGESEAALEREILKAFTVGEERTFEQDPALAIRLLADIALRALSPAVNDPTTATQAIDTMDGLFRVLATRELSVECVPDRDGTIRVELVLPTWDDYLAIALDEIIALPGHSPNVSRRILRLLDDLTRIAPPRRRSALQTRRRQIHKPDAQASADATA